MKIQVKQVLYLLDQYGVEIPYTDNRLYDVPCERCGPMSYVGRYRGRFLCLGCIDEIDFEEEASHERQDNFQVC